VVAGHTAVSHKGNGDRLAIAAFHERLQITGALRPLPAIL
jgi:hypothetical protein